MLPSLKHTKSKAGDGGARAQAKRDSADIPKKVFQSVFKLSGEEEFAERSSDYVVSVKALGGNCSGTRGETANREFFYQPYHTQNVKPPVAEGKREGDIRPVLR